MVLPCQVGGCGGRWVSPSSATTRVLYRCIAGAVGGGTV